MKDTKDRLIHWHALDRIMGKRGQALRMCESGYVHCPACYFILCLPSSAHDFTNDCILKHAYGSNFFYCSRASFPRSIVFLTPFTPWLHRISRSASSASLLSTIWMTPHWGIMFSAHHTTRGFNPVMNGNVSAVYSYCKGSVTRIQMSVRLCSL